MEQEVCFTFFKFYLEWYEIIKTYPDKERLSAYDIICENAMRIIKGEEPTFEGANPMMIGYMNKVCQMLKDDVHKTKDLKNKKSEGGKKAMERRWNKQPESKPQQYNRDIVKQELRDLLNMLVVNPQAVKAFCQNEGITCVNAYFAYCHAFLNNHIASGGIPHDDTNTLYKHFTSWFITISGDRHTFSKIDNSVQDEFRQWNEDFPQGSEDIATCNIEKIAREYKRLTKTK